MKEEFERISSSILSAVPSRSIEVSASKISRFIVLDNVCFFAVA